MSRTETWKQRARFAIGISRASKIAAGSPNPT
jgi:hypothetical protein